MDKMLATILSTSLFGLFIFGMLCHSYIFYRIFTFDENYLGWNILYLIPLFALILVLTVCRMSLENYSGYLNYGLLFFGGVSILLIVSFYYLNILVPYEVWLERGMPERPF